MEDRKKRIAKVTFVILHYQLSEMTMQCVDIIKKIIDYENYDILIVDNASPNGSGKVLKNLYFKDECVNVILNSDNAGFSKGNNEGYKVAKDNGAKFIIVMNNDVEVQQSDFIQKIIQIYKKTDCYVLGPDIVNLAGVHQSPQRDHFICKKELRTWYVKRKIFLSALILSDTFKGINAIMIKKYIQHDKKRIGGFEHDKIKENVELQGACFIFTPNFIEKREIAFEEISFMYGEETMLACLCKKNNWKILYNPEIRVLHKEKSTTRNEKQEYIQHEIFYTQNLLIGLQGVKNKMDEWGLE